MKTGTRPPHRAIAAALTALGATALFALPIAAQASTAADEHAAHDKAAAPPDPLPYPATPAKPAAPAMDHGNMNMQGGSAPPDARDPHAYSGGHTLQSGPSALSGPRLRLADEHLFATVLIDRLEWVRSRDGEAGDYDALGWFGTSYDRLVIKAEGEFAHGKAQEARTEALWGHAIATYWDTQLGVRNDYRAGGSGRNWLAFGVQGLAPYWFEVDVTGYVGNEGRTALRLSGEYELLLTQKLILQPRVEANLYGKNDVENGIGKGLSDLSVGLRLRYEIARQFAPYIGVAWGGKFGNTANMAAAAGERKRDTTFVAGVRMWF